MEFYDPAYSNINLQFKNCWWKRIVSQLSLRTFIGMFLNFYLIRYICNLSYGNHSSIY